MDGEILVHDEWRLTCERAAIHLPTGTAVIADLHLGYCLARRRAGEAVPEANLDEVLAPLSALLARHAPKRLVIAGDLVEDGRSAEPVAELLSWLRANGLDWVGLVPGNHDRYLSAGSHLQVFPTVLRLGDWQIVHGDERTASGKLVHGHVHPGLRLPGGPMLSCFLVGPDRIILPAFSLDAAGVNILGRRELSRYRCVAIAEEEIRDLGEVHRLKRALR